MALTADERNQLMEMVREDLDRRDARRRRTPEQVEADREREEIALAVARKAMKNFKSDVVPYKSEQDQRPSFEVMNTPYTL